MLASTAEATTFTLSSYDVTYQTSDPGLVLWESDILSDGSSFTLTAVGDSFTTALFRIGTSETALNLDDWTPEDISVDFQFSTPLPGFGGDTSGISGAFWLGTSVGYVLWDNPLLLAFGSTGLLSVTLTNALFTLPGSSLVYATFQLVQADAGTLASTIGTPEPTTLMLMALGLMLAAAFVYRFRAIPEGLGR